MLHLDDSGDFAYSQRRVARIRSRTRRRQSRHKRVVTVIPCGWQILRRAGSANANAEKIAVEKKLLVTSGNCLTARVAPSGHGELACDRQD